MPAYYKGQPVFGIMGGGGNEFIKWQVKSYPSADSKNFNLYHDGYYYCCIGVIYRTQDFLSYEDIRPVSNTANWRILIHDGTQFIAKQYNVNAIYTSLDAETWTRITTTGLNSQVTCMTYFKGKYIAWKEDTSGYNPYVSTDLAKWTSKTSPGSLSGNYILTEDILVTQKYYPSSTTPIIYTEDGETFLNCDPLDSTLSLNYIAYANGVFLACDSNGTVIKSTDGKHWEVAAQNPNYVYLASFKNEFLAFPATFFSYDGNITKAIPALRSKDGVTWEELEGSYGYGMQGTAINGKFFVTNPDPYYNLLIGE